MESECPYCNRLFCAECKVAWHSGATCAEFQKLRSDERSHDDIMLANLAKKKKWSRCPKCRFYVERIDGCLVMKCRYHFFVLSVESSIGCCPLYMEGIYYSGF